MLGTEGRRPGHEVAPTNDVYDEVVFRSADIEDLQIFEPAPPKPSFADPAIISSVYLMQALAYYFYRKAPWTPLVPCLQLMPPHPARGR